MSPKRASGTVCAQASDMPLELCLSRIEIDVSRNVIRGTTLHDVAGYILTQRFNTKSKIYRLQNNFKGIITQRIRLIFLNTS